MSITGLYYRIFISFNFILDSSLSLDETTDEIIDEDAVLGVSFIIVLTGTENFINEMKVY